MFLFTKIKNWHNMNYEILKSNKDDRSNCSYSEYSRHYHQYNSPNIIGGKKWNHRTITIFSCRKWFKGTFPRNLNKPTLKAYAQTNGLLSDSSKCRHLKLFLQILFLSFDFVMKHIFRNTTYKQKIHFAHSGNKSTQKSIQRH